MIVVKIIAKTIIAIAGFFALLIFICKDRDPAWLCLAVLFGFYLMKD